MSCATSLSAGRVYGVARVAREWELARSSFYHQRGLAGQFLRVFQRRGPRTAWTDAALTEKIREVLAASPFYGEGHRKVWARLRHAGVRTSKARVLRLMREARLLAPCRTVPAGSGKEISQGERLPPTVCSPAQTESCVDSTGAGRVRCSPARAATFN